MSATEQKSTDARLQLLLDSLIPADHSRTLLINGLPGNVCVAPKQPLVVGTGPRSDTALAAIKAVGRDAKQIVIVGELPWLKEFAEQLAREQSSINQFPIHFVTGGEVIPESFREYLSRLLKHHHWNFGSLVVSFGVSEVGLSVGQETPSLASLRVRAERDSDLRSQLFGSICPFLPTLVAYDPAHLLVETCVVDGASRLVLTTLEPNRRLPLIRYCTGDLAQTLDSSEIRRVLRALKIPVHPLDHLPVLAVWGRAEHLLIGTRSCYTDHVKAIYYAHPDIARSTTGNFQCRKGPDGRLMIRIQSKADISTKQDEISTFEATLVAQLAVPVKVQCVPFEQYSGVSIDLQRKFRYA